MQFGDPKSFAESDTAMGTMGAFYDEFLQPRSNAGLRDLLRLKILPEVDGLYRDDWLISPDFEKAVEDHIGEVPLRDFWETDLESYQTYKARNGRPFVEGVLITHAHADHFQHLAYVDPEIPVYCTAVTKSIIKTAGDVAQQRDTTESYEARLRRHLVQSGKTAKFPGTWAYPKDGKNATASGAYEKQERPFIIVEPWTPFKVGAFEVVAIPIDHSVPGACFFLVKGQDGKRVLYTGDFRFHGIYEKASGEARRRLADLRPDAMLCEGTRIDNDHTVYETDVLQTTKRTISEHDGLIMAEWGWKDATRFLTMQQAAEADGRTLVIDPRLATMLHRLADIDPEYKPPEAYGNVRVYIKRAKSMTYSPGDYKSHELGYLTDWDKETTEAARRWFMEEDGAPAPPAMAHYADGIRADQIRKNPGRYVLQSSFFQMSELFDLDPPKDSYYIKSSCEPFNDEMASDQRKHMNWLDQWGIGTNMRADSSHLHHTSGHASGAELADFWKTVKPEALVPIHTQHPGKYQELWESGNIQLPRYNETFTI